MHELVMTLRNPLDKRDMLPVYIRPNGTELSYDWMVALKMEIDRQAELEKNYCWHGWPKTQRNLEYLCAQLTRHATKVNEFNATGIWQAAGLETYDLKTDYSPSNVMHPITGID